MTDWSSDPWALGAYSAQGVHSWAADPLLLARSVGPLHFAGEYLGGEFAGLMEGALRSGINAAAQILN